MFLFQLFDRRPARRVPEPDIMVITASHDPPAVGRKGHGINVISMPAQQMRLFHRPGLQVPHTRRLVTTARNQVTPIRREGERKDYILMPLEQPDHRPAAKIVQTDGMTIR